MKKLVMLLVVIGFLFTSCKKDNVGPQGSQVPENASKNYALLYKADLLKATTIGHKVFPYYDQGTNQWGVSDYGEFFTVKVYIDLGFDSKGRVKQSDTPITVEVRGDDVTLFRSLALDNNMMRTGLGKTTYPDGKTIDIIYYIN